MDIKLRDDFMAKWERYFPDAELPITFYLDEGTGQAEIAPIKKGHSCLICELNQLRQGKSLCYGPEAVACGGAKRYLGYAPEVRPDFDYFLSCGKPGLEGERYLRTPDMVKTITQNQKLIPANGRHYIFKRWDHLLESDQPDVAIFFATPDILSGLFTLANFDQTEPNATFTPFGPGCGTIIHHPYFEKDSSRPRAVIGLFDPSARPCVKPDILTFSVPLVKLARMTAYMDESFLITGTWEKMKRRIKERR